jgi:hypothetical protein
MSAKHEKELKVAMPKSHSIYLKTTPQEAFKLASILLSLLFSVAFATEKKYACGKILSWVAKE